jgi:hypothetical protein
MGKNEEATSLARHKVYCLKVIPRKTGTLRHFKTFVGYLDELSFRGQLLLL